MSAADRADLAAPQDDGREDQGDRGYQADRARTALPQNPADPPGSVAGPVVPTATASGTHQPPARAALAGGLLRRWQDRNLSASLPLALRQLEDAGNLDNVRLAIQAT